MNKNDVNLEERLSNLERIISQKNMPQDEKEKLLIEVEKLKKILKEKGEKF